MEPRPPAGALPACELERPEVGERLAGAVGELARLPVPVREDEGVEHGLGPSGFARLGQADGLVGVVGLDLVPERNALADALHERGLGRGWTALAQGGP